MTSYTPLQLQLHAEHKARQARMNHPPVILAIAPPVILPPSDAIEPGLRRAKFKRLLAYEEERREKRLMREYLLAMSNSESSSTMGQILAATSTKSGYKIFQLRGERRHKALSLWRQIAMYLAREMTTYSSPRIAREFRRSDHTTILYGAKKIAALIENDVVLRAKVDSVRAMIETHAEEAAGV